MIGTMRFQLASLLPFSLVLLIFFYQSEVQAGIIKDLFQKVTHTGNKTDNEPVKQSAPICGSGLFFASADQQALSPEMIFITSTPSQTYTRKKINEVAKEFRFNVNNVTIDELEHYGFNRNAPVTILMHGFTSGYPLQAWMTGIVEAYTIERESENAGGSREEEYDSHRPSRRPSSQGTYETGNDGYNSHNHDNANSNYGRSTSRRPYSQNGYGSSNYNNRDKRQTSSAQSAESTRRRNSNDRDRYNNGNQNSQYGGGNHNNRDDEDGNYGSYGGNNHGNNNGNYGGNNHGNNHSNNYGNNHGGSSSANNNGYSNQSNHGASSSSNQGSGSNNRPNYSSSPSRSKVKHNLFIINWNYAAKGILYPRAVANIPIVASYGARFVNEKLIEQARIDPRRIQLIGHSLGAHLAGFIGKNTRSKVGRIYGLDPAGPCFGAYAGFLYPKAQRLAPSDAEEVITIQTNGVLLGHDKPLGRYSVYVEGGEVQPGCKGGGILKSLGAFTWDGADFDALACSHSRAPNLLMYNHQHRKVTNQKSKVVECELVAYECSNWKDFTKGFCGICSPNAPSHNTHHSSSETNPNTSVECIRLGLDWQYADKISPGQSSSGSGPVSGHNNDYNNNNNHHDYHDGSYSMSNRPSRNRRSNNSSYSQHKNNNQSDSTDSLIETRFLGGLIGDRDPRGYDKEVRPIEMYLRTSDTQPYCTYHYQIILELNERFQSRDPPMSLLLQDSESHRGGGSRSSLSTDEFGHRYSDLVYTHLLVSVQRVGKIEHATLIFRNGNKGGIRILKSLQINYMSNIDPNIRKKLSIRLCPVQKDESQDGKQSTIENTRFYFEQCNSASQSHSGSSSGHHDQSYGSDYSGSNQSGSSHSGHNQSGSGGHSGHNQSWGNNHSEENQSGSFNSGHSSGHSGYNQSGYNSGYGSGSGNHGSSSQGQNPSNYDRPNYHDSSYSRN